MCDLSEVGETGGFGCALLQMCDLAEVGGVRVAKGQHLASQPLIDPRFFSPD